MSEKENEEKIDFVLIWVDGSDPQWQKEKIKYSDNPDAVKNNVNRYRDWENLKYWFRGVERFAPWVNNVYFITCGHYPEWLNLNHTKLKFLKHEDYIPEEYLPTFSSHPIELNLHRIEGLSDKFVYFNDDMFLINSVSKEDFFKEDKPRFIAGCDAVWSSDVNDSFPHILLNNTALVNKYFDKKEVMKKNFFKWINFNYGIKVCMKNLLLWQFNKASHFVDMHIPVPIMKDTMKELWEKEFDVLNRTSSHKFRSAQDVSQYIFRYYDLLRGNFEPSNKNLGVYYSTNSQGIEKVTEEIKKQKHKIICFSDDMELDFEKAKKEVIDAFEVILPEKSSFEV